MQVKKAVILAAGFGTRMLPATKSLPKEMLPVVDKPVIQYIVEEAVRSGAEDILIITNRGKSAIEDHFDRSPELENRLHNSGNTEALNGIIGIANLANITYIRQKETKGLGHAVHCAKNFVGNEPFFVLYGDDVIISDNPVCAQLAAAYSEYNLPVVGIKEVSDESIAKYSSMKLDVLHDNIYRISDMIEKPAPGFAFSNFSILGRCLLTPDIFPILEAAAPGAGGEIQLTDAIAEIARRSGVIGVDFDGVRYDMGDKLGILKAIVELGLIHPVIGKEFAEYLQKRDNGTI